MAKKVGRPEKWTAEVVKQMQNDLQEWLFEVDGKGKVKEHTQLFPMDFLQSKYFISRKILAELQKKYPEFRNTVEIAKEICENRLIRFTATGELNGKFVQFLLQAKHGFVPVSKIEGEGEGAPGAKTKGNQPINIVFQQVNDRKDVKKDES